MPFRTYLPTLEESSGAVTEDMEDELPKQQTQGRCPRCPTCAAFTRLAHSMLNPRNGKAVRLYQCHCGERVWDD